MKLSDDGFLYWIWLRSRRGRPYVYEGSVLPGLIPSRVLDLMECRVVDGTLELCKSCDVQGGRCHVIEAATGRKLCPILFVDAAKPGWTVEEVL